MGFTVEQEERIREIALEVLVAELEKFLYVCQELGKAPRGPSQSPGDRDWVGYPARSTMLGR